MDYMKRAEELKDEAVKIRRYLHSNAETGLYMPKAKACVMEKLESYGITPQDCSYGVTAVMGRDTGRTLLLRADMDALPMGEESGLPFACKSGTEAHTCGHDLHTVMLLTAAKMLKENESSLNGRVKLMFQPGEEILEGARAMIGAGALEAPRPDAALGFHVGAGGVVGTYWYNPDGVMMLSSDGFEITVSGRGGHSGYPHTTVDPVGAAVQIYTALQHMAVYERDPEHTGTVAVCQFHAGDAYNIIPEKAVLRGSIRTSDPGTRENLVKRLEDIAKGIASANRASAEVKWFARCPALVCDKAVTEKMVGIMGGNGLSGIRSSGSDDFAEIASRVPSAYIFLAAGFPDKEPVPSHNPKVIFNEDVIPFGAAMYARCAEDFLSG